MNRFRPAVVAALFTLVALVVPGCSGGDTTSGPTNASAASPSSPISQTYASKEFKPALTVTVDPSLKSPPQSDSTTLLSWDAVNSSSNKVRFLAPTSLYRPGSIASEAPPENYLKYLQGLTSHGAQLSQVTKITVDGHPATLMTATSAGRPQGYFDGTLGCPNVGADQAEGCYGIQPDLLLRLAVIPVGHTTLLAWARTSKASLDEAFFAMFEKMLESVKFR